MELQCFNADTYPFNRSRTLYICFTLLIICIGMAPPSLCAICGEIATLRCSGCAEGLDDNDVPSQTYNCQEKCRAADSEAHEPICCLANGHKQLYRGAQLVQEAFCIFREEAFDTKIAKIEVKGGKLNIYQGVSKDGLLHIYSSHLVHDDKVKKAILICNTCDKAPAYIRNLIEKVLVGKLYVVLHTTATLMSSTQVLQVRRTAQPRYAR